MAQYLKQVLIALDQLINALLGGMADETLSARAWRTEQDGKMFGRLFRPVIDFIFIVITFGRDHIHCFRSYTSEVERKQNHPHYSL